MTKLCAHIQNAKLKNASGLRCTCEIIIWEKCG